MAVSNKYDLVVIGSGSTGQKGVFVDTKAGKREYNRSEINDLLCIINFIYNLNPNYS